LRGLGASFAYKARESQAGDAPMPTMAMAELLRNTRRVAIGYFLYFL
jgi:hypothetical protein